MIGALVSLALIAGGAIVVGQALAAIAAGARRGSPLAPDPMAPALGLAAMLVVAGVAIRLPGHAVTAAVALGVLVLAAAVLLPGRTERPRGLPAAAATVLLTGLGASLPFLIAGFVGVLGAGLVNDDMASHLIIADYIADPGGPEPSFVRGGYPTGPHAIVAAIAEVSGFGLVDVFAGLTLALPVLTGLTALGLLRDLRPLPRVAAASLVALAYLAAAYLAQGAFKEPMMALLLLGLVVWLARALGEERTAEGGPQASVSPLFLAVPPLVIAAGVVFAYSLPGLLWVAAVGVAALLARIVAGPRIQLPEGWARRALPYAGGALVLAGVLAVLEWERISTFTRFDALNPDRFGSRLGNLAQSLNPLEALGIWPASDFDATPTSTSVPELLFYAGGLVALAAFAAGIVVAVRARRVSLPAAAVAALAVWGLLAIAGSPYVAAKGLAIAAPLVMAVALRGTLASRSLPLLALGLALLAGGAGSTFLILRAAAVGPEAHANQLDEIAAQVQGEDVLFLGRDDFIGWELAGSGEITGVVANFYDVEDIRPRFSRGEGGGEKFDVDVLFPRQLGRFDWVLATRGGPASQVPPRFEVAAETRDYVLYERTGAIGRRSTLDEGIAVGAVLNCESDAGRELSRQDGIATIWDPPPVIGEAEGWKPDAEPSDGSPAAQTLEIPEAGRWLISIEYDSRRPIRVSSAELELEATVAANLDFRGETPPFPVAEVEVDGPTEAEVSVEPEQPNGLARLLRAPNEAHLRSLTATPLDPGAVRRVPLTQACGEFVDWYRAG